MNVTRREKNILIIVGVLLVAVLYWSFYYGGARDDLASKKAEIGRASCRERV